MVLRLQRVGLAFGGAALLDQVDFTLVRGERVCLVGRNGSGKSSLMKLMAGEIEPDSGRVERRQGLRMVRLDQAVPPAEGTRTALDVASEADPAAADTRIQGRVEAMLGRLGVAPGAVFASLSGGMRRRVMLARVLAAEAEVVLLDEPTNHLDIQTVVAMEELLRSRAPTLVFVSHDRRFIDRLATRIVELDRGALRSFAPPFSSYRERRAEQLRIEAEQAARFDRRLAAEERWIRKGIEARRTRNEGRVRALEAMRGARAARRVTEAQANLAVNAGERSGKLVLEAESLQFAWPDGRVCVRDFSALVLRGDRVGLVGPNGCGKTTLLRLLLGEIAPEAGRVRHGTGLQIAYFDQLREGLDEQASVRENVAGGAEQVLVGGRPRHVVSYLRDFLFDAERAATPVARLSGGERNRLLLARLFARPSNLLVLDEPTNDLDIETLEVLESVLAAYPGTVLLASHDRELLDNVVTSVLVFEGDGRIREVLGGYREVEPPPVPRPAGARARAPARAARGADEPRLGFREQRELAALPALIESMEAEIGDAHARMGEADYYRRASDEIAADRARLDALEARLAEAYARWEQLEALRR